MNVFIIPTQSSKYKPSHGDDVKNTKNKMQEELQRLNNDRWFLQRLCNDLKFALQASHNQTQVQFAYLLTQTDDAVICFRF